MDGFAYKDKRKGKSKVMHGVGGGQVESEKVVVVQVDGADEVARPHRPVTLSQRRVERIAKGAEHVGQGR